MSNHAGSLFRGLGIQLGQRRGAGDAVGVDGVALLEGDDRSLGGFGKLAVSGAAEVAQHDQPVLQDLDLGAGRAQLEIDVRLAVGVGRAGGRAARRAAGRTGRTR